MSRKYNLPFKLGDEIEAKFNETGYRGAWFRCRIAEIKDSTPEPSLLLEYVDFPDEAYSWTRVRQPDLSVKIIEPWLQQKRPLIWMVRPKAPIVHESIVEKYQEDIRTGRKCADYIHIYNDKYMVGDSVDFLKDDCFWAAQIVEIITETNEAKIKFPLPPVGEGNGDLQLVSFKDLRPSFSWNPLNWWRHLGSKKKAAATGVDKPHIQLVYLSGDSMIPAVLSNGRCKLFSSGDPNSVRKSEHDESSVNSCGTAKEQRRNKSDSHELVVTSNLLHEESKCVRGPSQSTSDACQEHDGMYDRVKFRHTCTGDGSIKQKAPDKVKPETHRRRKVQFTSSFVLSDSDEEEQGSWRTPRNPLATAGAILSRNDSKMVSEFEVLNLIPSTTHALNLDASTAPSQLAATSPTGIRGELDSYSEHFRDGTAVGDLVNDSGAIANEEISEVKFVIPDTALENEVSATSGSPGNLDGRNNMSSILKPNSSLGNIAESSSVGSAGLNKDPKCNKAVPEKTTLPVESPGSLDRVTSPLEQITDNVCDFNTIEAEDAKSEDRLQVHLIISAETSTIVKNLPSTDITTAHSMEIAEEPYAFEGVAGVVQQSAPEHGALFLIPENTTGDGNHGKSEVCAPGGDLNEEQATGSRADVVSKDASAPLSGRMKLLSHRNCVAIKKAIDIGRSRKRRRGKDQFNTSRKRLCQAYTNRTVDLSVFQANGFLEEPLSSSLPPTPSHDERKSSVFGSIVKLEPGTYEDENRTHVPEDPNFEPLWVIALPRIGAGELPTVRHPSITPSGEVPSAEAPIGEAPVEEVPIAVPIAEAPIAGAPVGEASSAKAPSGTVDLEDIDALERLSARVHFLGALLSDKMKKRKRIVWKISDGMFFSRASTAQLPKMRGSIKPSQEKPVRLKESKVLQKTSLQGKLLDAIIGRKDQFVEPVSLQQEQQCSILLPTGLQALEGESKEHKNWHQSEGNADYEALDNESEEDKVKLQPNGKWCMKALTVDGKVEWIGSYLSKKEALSIYHVVNCSSSLKEKAVPALSHTSSSCFREQAGGSRVSPEPSSNEKQLKRSTSSKSSESNASEFSSRIVEPNVESTVFIGKEVNGTAVGVSRLDTISGADLQEGDGQDTGTDHKTLLNKLAETCEQESLAVSTKGGASVGLEVEINPVLPTETYPQRRCNTMKGATAFNLTEGLLGLSSREVVNDGDKDIRPGEIVQEKPLVKVKCPVPQVVEAVPAGVSAHDSWIHDSVRCCYGKDALGRASANGLETTQEKEVACKVKAALWQGMCCSSQSGGLGLDLFERVQLFVQSKMHFHRESDDTMLLSTGKPSEVIYLGKCKNDIEAGAARRILSRCKKELQKCIKSFERQSLVSSGAVAQAADSSPKVIVLDDDDGNEVPVAPVASVVPDSTSARAFADVTSMTNNIGAQREGTVQGNRACRTSGLLNDVVSAHPRQTQEEHLCHVAGGSYAGGYIGVRQEVPNNIQIINTSSYPMQSVVQTRGSPHAQMDWRTPQPVRQGPGSQQTSPTAFIFGNVVRQQQPTNQYEGYVLVDSSGRRVEIPSSHLQPMQGPVRAFTSHGPVNHPRELGSSTPLPTAFNISAAAAPRSTLTRRVYNCCPGIESSNEDFMLFKALCCKTCDRLVHTDCAIALHQLRLIQYLGQEKAVYTCQCQKIWEIIPQILNRMKEFTNLIWNQQKERLNRDSTPLSVIQFDKGQELNVIMGTLYKILFLTRDPGLKSILEFVKCMNRNMWVDANRVNFLEWIQFLDAALKFVKMT